MNLVLKISCFVVRACQLIGPPKIVLGGTVTFDKYKEMLKDYFTVEHPNKMRGRHDLTLTALFWLYKLTLYVFSFTYTENSINKIPEKRL